MSDIVSIIHFKKKMLLNVANRIFDVANRFSREIINVYSCRL